MPETITIEGDAAALFGALAEAQATFGELKRTRTVKVQTQTGSYSFDYAPLEEVLASCLPALNKHGLVFIQPLGWNEKGDVLLHSVLAHKSGARLVSTVKVPQGQGRDVIKDMGSSVTYMRRYAAQALLGISAEPDDDAGQASGHKTDVVRDGGKSVAQVPKPAVSPVPVTIPPSTSDLEKKYPGGGVAWNQQPEAAVPELGFKPASQTPSPPAPTHAPARASSVETSAGGGAVCVDCGNPVPATVVEARRVKFGVVVCVGCSRKREAVN